MSSAVVSSDQLLQQLHWRYATKQFDSSQKIPAGIWQTLEESLVLTPSSFGLQPWMFFVITHSDLREKLVEYSWGQRQVADASHLVVLAIKKDFQAADVDRYIERIAEVRQVPIESLDGFSKTMKGFLNGPIDLEIWASRQVYIALGQLMASAALLGIDACPMEGFDRAKYDEVLGLGDRGYSASVLCPLGYRAADDKYASLAKVRYPKSSVVQYI